MKMVDTKVIKAVGVGLITIMIVLLVMGIFTPIALDSQDSILNELNESIGLDANNNTIGKYVSNADVTDAKTDTGNILVNTPTFLWLGLLFVVLGSIGFAVFKASKR